MVVSVLIIWALLRNSKTSLSRRLLAIVFLCLFFVSFQYYGEMNGIKLIYAIGYLFSDPIGFTIGPLLYLYIKSLHQKNTSLLKKHRLHFLPLVVYFSLVSLPIFIAILGDRDIFKHYNYFIDKYYFLLHIQAIYLFVYALFSLRLLSKYQKAAKDNYSNLVEKDLNWVRYYLIAVMVLMSVDLITLCYDLFIGSVADVSYVTTFVMVFIILYLGYYGSSQAQIFLPAHLIEKADIPKNKVLTHSLTSASTIEVQQLKQSLERILQEEKPYLDEELTLGALAKMLPTTDKKLSALLNHELNTNFYDLINHYRVEAVKAKMEDSNFEHYTFLAIAFECGFKSKTSFNRIFKKETGLSPSAYKKQTAESYTTLV